MSTVENDSPLLTSETLDSTNLVERLKQQSQHVTGTDRLTESRATQTSSFPIQKSSPILTGSELEMLRLIGQYLQSVGLSETVTSLILESHCTLEPDQVSNFRRLIMSGKWSEALVVLETLRDYIEEKDGIKQMVYSILEQKYFELIEDDQRMDALNCLRYQIRPLDIFIDRTHQLTSFLMFNSIKEMCEVAKWKGKGLISREILLEKLQKYLPPHVMLPPRRLETLISQAIELQQLRCTYHLEPGLLKLNDTSLLKDHSCPKETLNCVTIDVLTDHSDEVWFCKFSPDGTKLATGSKDCFLIVYDVDMVTYQLQLRKRFHGHSHGVACIAWCPFSRYVIVCGTDDCHDIWIWDIETEEQRTRMQQHGEDSLTCAAWLPCGHRFVCAGSRGQFYLCDIDGKLLQSWEGVRIQCLNVTQEGQILAADLQKRISLFKFDSKTDQHLIREDHPIMSFTLSKDGRFALLNIANQGVHLWDLHDKILIRKYQGVSQGNYVNHSSFGGPNEEFLISGSEDSKVYLWHRRQEHPILTFSGHKRTVNCVSWHPTLPLLFASASDDNTVRLWSTIKYKQESSIIMSDDDE